MPWKSDEKSYLDEDNDAYSDIHDKDSVCDSEAHVDCELVDARFTHDDTTSQAALISQDPKEKIISEHQR